MVDGRPTDMQFSHVSNTKKVFLFLFSNCRNETKWNGITVVASWWIQIKTGATFLFFSLRKPRWQAAQRENTTSIEIRETVLLIYFKTVFNNEKGCLQNDICRWLPWYCALLHDVWNGMLNDAHEDERTVSLGLNWCSVDVGWFFSSIIEMLSPIYYKYFYYNFKLSL